MRVCKIVDLMKLVFSGLSPRVIDDVTDEGERIVVRARAPGATVACAGCAVVTGRVHGYHQRTLADVSVDARPVVLSARAASGVPDAGLSSHVPGTACGYLECYQRRTRRPKAMPSPTSRQCDQSSESGPGGVAHPHRPTLPRYRHPPGRTRPHRRPRRRRDDHLTGRLTGHDELQILFLWVRPAGPASPATRTATLPQRWLIAQ